MRRRSVLKEVLRIEYFYLRPRTFSSIPVANASHLRRSVRQISSTSASREEGESQATFKHPLKKPAGPKSGFGAGWGAAPTFKSAPKLTPDEIDQRNRLNPQIPLNAPRLNDEAASPPSNPKPSPIRFTWARPIDSGEKRSEEPNGPQRAFRPSHGGSSSFSNHRAALKQSLPVEDPLAHPAPRTQRFSRPQRSYDRDSIANREIKFRENGHNQLGFRGFRGPNRDGPKRDYDMVSFVVGSRILSDSPGSTQLNPQGDTLAPVIDKDEEPEAQMPPKDPPPSTRQHAELKQEEMKDDYDNMNLSPKKQRNKGRKSSSRLYEENDDDFEVRSRRPKRGRRAVNDIEEDFDSRYDDLEEDERPRRKKAPKKKKDAPTPIYLPEFISVINLASSLSVPPSTFLESLKELGFDDATYDHVLDAETAGLIATEYNFEPVLETTNEDLVAQPLPEDTSTLPSRPPVVTIMGHVDHGKTTILDWLRKSSVAASEHGGITQHIGAFSVKMPSGKQITFLDTPGHAAFLEMRRRGANVTDIVILVVAADDSIKPQTLEAIKHAKEANVPMIVAINKIDKDDVDVEKVKRDLARHNVNIEDFGGDVQAVGVSGKTGQGMMELEEAAVTLSEMLDLRADREGSVEGWVIEATTKPRGKVATILVRRGVLKTGHIVVAGTAWARIRNLRNEDGAEVQEVLPGNPVEIDGWRGDPLAGNEVFQVETEQGAKNVVEFRLDKEDLGRLGGDTEAINIARRERRQRELAAENGSEVEPELGYSTPTGPKGIPFIIKGDVSGSVEAIVNSISAIGNNEVYAKILRTGVGPVSGFDIDHAAAANGHIISFNQDVSPEYSRTAEAGGVAILNHKIIYELIDDVKTRLSEHLPPNKIQRVSGEAEISQIFEITLKGRVKTLIAGCRVNNGVITRGHKVRVYRDNEVVYDGTISSLKNIKKDVMEMRKGSECGMAFDHWTSFEEGDEIQTYEEILEKRFL